MDSPTEQKPRTLQQELGKRCPFASLEQETYLNLVRTVDRLGEAYERFFKEHGISPPLYNVLRIVQGGGERGVYCQTIGRHLITRQPDVTRLVDRLEKMGFVARERCGEDRRVVWVRITDEGRALIRSLEGRVLEIHQSQLSHLGPEKLRQLNELLVEARSQAIGSE